jgi:hypothetical protein
MPASTLLGKGPFPGDSRRPSATGLNADLTQAQREKIFGDNLRRIAGPLFHKKGYKLRTRTAPAARQGEGRAQSAPANQGGRP